MHSIKSALEQEKGQSKSQKVQNLLNLLNELDVKTDVHICSIGGVGSTTLNNFLVRNGLQTNQLKDQDGLRHINRPPKWSKENAPHTVIYIYGNPLLTIQSHYRRNQALHQGVVNIVNPDSENATFLCRSEDSYFKKGYFCRNEDLFGAVPHFKNWLHTETEYDIVFVRYENMFEVEIATKLLSQCFKPKQLNEDKIRDLAQQFHGLFKQRNYEVNELGVYKDIVEEMSQLPPIFLRMKTCKIISL